MSTPLEKIRLRYESLLARYKEFYGDGKISWSEGFTLFLEAMGSIIMLTQEYADHPYEERKAIGVDLCVEFWEKTGKQLDLPLPNWIEGPVDNAIGLMIRPLVESLYDGIHNLIQGKFTRPEDLD